MIGKISRRSVLTAAVLPWFCRGTTLHGTVLSPFKKGWQATLDLHFQQAGGKTVLASAQHAGSLTVQRPFYPEEETCHLYLLHPLGGIVGGDELTVIAHLDPGRHTLITMPGTSKFYRGSGTQALLHQWSTLAPQATLEWLPQDVIFFPGANARLSTAFHLCVSSTLLTWDLLCPDRPVIGGTFSYGTLNNQLEVWVDEIPLLVERLYLQGGELFSVAEYPWIDTLLYYPATDALFDGVCDALAPLGLYAGISLTDRLLTVRLLSDDNLICQRVMRDIRQFLHPHLTNRPPVFPRTWLT